LAGVQTLVWQRSPNFSLAGLQTVVQTEGRSGSPNDRF